MSMQKELREWADKTAKGYVAIANEVGEKAPSFYTQSDLTKIMGSPKVVVHIDGGGISVLRNPSRSLDRESLDGTFICEKLCLCAEGVR